MKKYFCPHCGRPVVPVDNQRQVPLADDVPLESVEMSVRARNCLTNPNIRWPESCSRPNTVGELRRISDHYLMKVRNLGKFTVAEIRSFAPYCQ